MRYLWMHTLISRLEMLGKTEFDNEWLHVQANAGKTAGNWPKCLESSAYCAPP
jgi:hypothetical protein